MKSFLYLINIIIVIINHFCCLSSWKSVLYLMKIIFAFVESSSIIFVSIEIICIIIEIIVVIMEIILYLISLFRGK